MSVWNSLRRGWKKAYAWVSLGKFFFIVLYSLPPSGIKSSLDKELFFFFLALSLKSFLFRKELLSYLTGSVSSSPLTRSLLRFMRTCCHLDVCLYCVSITEPCNKLDALQIFPCASGRSDCLVSDTISIFALGSVPDFTECLAGNGPLFIGYSVHAAAL